jgi:hypothetical protein
MRSTFRTLASLSIFAVFLTLPQAQAASVGDAFRDTFKAPNFRYDATADLQLKKGGDADFPFDLQLTVTEKGGKNGTDLGKDGSFEFRVKNFKDLPSNLKDFQSFAANVDYRGTVLRNGAVQYAEVTNALLSADSGEVSKITSMLNQLAKFITGRTFKFSPEEVARLIREQSQGNSFLGDSEMILMLLSAGKSIDQIISSFGLFIDDLLASGVLVDEVTTSTVRNAGIMTSSGVQIHHLRFGRNISAAGAKKFDEAFKKFIRSVFPGSVGEFITANIDLSPTMNSELNEFLQKASVVDFDLSFEVKDGVLQNTLFKVDLNRTGIPLTFLEIVSFDYSAAYPVIVPQDERSIIDLNAIVEGFVAIAKLATPTFDNASFVNPELSGEGAHPGVQNLFDSIQFSCPDSTDKVCARREARQQLRFARNQYTARDFAKLRRELNAMVNQYYY